MGYSVTHGSCRLGEEQELVSALEHELWHVAALMFQDNRSIVFEYTYLLMFEYPVYRRCTCTVSRLSFGFLVYTRITELCRGLCMENVA
jgi:hypothetical protein